MDKATGEPLLVGEEQAQVTAEVEFTPESADGTVELTYTLDASTLAGTTIVVFETLYSDGVEMCIRDRLPYGEYILHESATNESMLNTVPDQTVLIEDDGVIYEFTCPCLLYTSTARAYFLQCGNGIVQPANPDEATAEILYQIFNRRSCQTEP